MRSFLMCAVVSLAACQSPPPAVISMATPVKPPCTIDATPIATTCTNLLALNWASAKTGAQVEALVATIKGMAPSTPVLNQDSVKQRRKSEVECRKNSGNKENSTVDLAYVRPSAMVDFPVDGTGGRDLVTAIFASDRDDDCMEFRYGGVKQHGGWKRLMTFNTVSTKKSVVPSDASREDIVIGEWRAWAIETRGAASYRVHELKRGAFVRCGFPHGEQHGNLAFITCKDARQLHAMADSIAAGAPGDVAARSTNAVEQAFAALIARYNSGDQALRSMLDGDSFEAPAWGRCGNLGCCASY